ncbi:MAG: hypothetical protein ACRDHL_11920, partial [Candidatus Promineifilaceae bacterium]
GLALWLAYGAWRARPPLLGGEAIHRWQGPSGSALALCAELRRLPLAEGRVLVDDFRLAALLPWCSGAQLFGAHHHHVWTSFGWSSANPLEITRRPIADFTAADWEQLKERYALRWLVLNELWRRSEWFTFGDWLEAHPGRATLRAEIGPYGLYAVDDPPAALPAAAGYDQLLLSRPPAGEPAVLPYHWLPGLELAAGADGRRLGPVARPPDPVPFVGLYGAGEGPILICLAGRCGR